MPRIKLGTPAPTLSGAAVETAKAAGATLARAAASESTLADEVREVTEQINPLIARAEAVFAAKRLGVTASVVLDSGEDWTSYLTFRKQDGEWCLLVETGPNHDPEVGSVKRLHATSRATRLAALDLLPELEEKLLASAEKQKAKARETVHAATAFIEERERRAK